MIVIFAGPAGSGKTILMSRLLRKRWKKGEIIYSNFPLWFDEDQNNIVRWHNLAETYHLKKGCLAIDESQKLLDARKWSTLPSSFTEKIAMHRHHHLDIFTTTQDFGHIDVRMRTNAHELFECRSIIRLPGKQTVKPIFQICKAIRKTRSFNSETQSIRWTKTGSRRIFISKFWTKTYFDTYGEVGGPHFVCRIQSTCGKWKGKLYSRELTDRGKARL